MCLRNVISSTGEKSAGQLTTVNPCASLRVVSGGGGTTARVLSDMACMTSAVAATQASLPRAATISASVQVYR